MIFLSAGHNNNDPGAIANGYKESQLTIEARNLIAKDTDNTILDKDWETNRQHQNRIKPGSGSVLFDIHFNAAGPTAGGVECIVNSADFKNKSSLSYKMADEVCKITSKILGIPNRGVKPESYTRHGKVGILNKGAGVSVLWEICFITSVIDMQKYHLCKTELHTEIAKILKKYDDLK